MSEPRAPADVAADVHLDRAVVAALIERQHPDVAGPVTRLSEGWDNVVFRVGERWLARMPRRALGAANVVREQTWLPRLPPLSLPIPVPERVGEPDLGYPYPWSLVPYLPGQAVGDHPVEPEPLARFLRELHVQAPADAPEDAARSMALAQRGDAVAERLAWCSAEDRVALEALWADALEAPLHTGPRLWCHGDLHPYNLLRQRSTITGVIDWGDLFAGDPAPDLAAVWMLFECTRHPTFQSGTTPDRWRRGRGWAIYFGVTLLDAAKRGAGAGFGAVGTATLRRLVEAYRRA